MTAQKYQPKPKEIRVEVGKRYLNRMGEIITIFDSRVWAGRLSFIGEQVNSEYTLAYYENGRWLLKHESGKDLVSEYHE